MLFLFRFFTVATVVVTAITALRVIPTISVHRTWKVYINNPGNHTVFTAPVRGLIQLGGKTLEFNTHGPVQLASGQTLDISVPLPAYSKPTQVASFLTVNNKTFTATIPYCCGGKKACMDCTIQKVYLK